MISSKRWKWHAHIKKVYPGWWKICMRSGNRIYAMRIYPSWQDCLDRLPALWKTTTSGRPS